MNAKKYDVFGIGHALVDVQFTASEETVAGSGFTKGVMTLVEPEQQDRVLAPVDPAGIERCTGGSVANTIIGVADLGGTTALAGKVGRDAYGEFFHSAAAGMGIAMTARPAEGRTGRCVVMITPDAQRTMLTHLGVSLTLGPDDVDEELIANSKFVLVEGYLFTSPGPKSAVYRTIELARRHGAKVAFSASDPFIVANHYDEFWGLLRGGAIDLLFCNLDEARRLTGKTDPAACSADLQRYAGHVAMTCGADGSVLICDGQTHQMACVACDAIDTTGAGDLYATGLLFGLTNGLSVEEAGYLASYTASRCVSQFGARLKEKFDPIHTVRCRPCAGGVAAP